MPTWPEYVIEKVDIAHKVLRRDPRTGRVKASYKGRALALVETAVGYDVVSLLEDGSEFTVASYGKRGAYEIFESYVEKAKEEGKIEAYK